MKVISCRCFTDASLKRRLFVLLYSLHMTPLIDFVYAYPVCSLRHPKIIYLSRTASSVFHRSARHPATDSHENTLSASDRMPIQAEIHHFRQGAEMTKNGRPVVKLVVPSTGSRHQKRPFSSNANCSSSSISSPSRGISGQ